MTLVDELERRHLLRRRSDPTDRRVRTLHLTAKGRALVRRLVEITNAHEAWLLSGLDSAESEHLLALLKKVASGLDVSDTAHTGLAASVWASMWFLTIHRAGAARSLTTHLSGK